MTTAQLTSICTSSLRTGRRLLADALAGAGVGGVLTLALAAMAGQRAVDMTPGADVLHLLRMCMASTSVVALFFSFLAMFAGKEDV